LDRQKTKTLFKRQIFSKESLKEIYIEFFGFMKLLMAKEGVL